jgi:hypothetical protein
MKIRWVTYSWGVIPVITAIIVGTARYSLILELFPAVSTGKTLGTRIDYILSTTPIIPIV